MDSRAAHSRSARTRRTPARPWIRSVTTSALGPAQRSISARRPRPRTMRHASPLTTMASSTRRLNTPPSRLPATPSAPPPARPPAARVGIAPGGLPSTARAAIQSSQLVMRRAYPRSSRPESISCKSYGISNLHPARSRREFQTGGSLNFGDRQRLSEAAENACNAGRRQRRREPPPSHPDAKGPGTGPGTTKRWPQGQSAIGDGR